MKFDGELLLGIVCRIITQSGHCFLLESLQLKGQRLGQIWELLPLLQDLLTPLEAPEQICWDQRPAERHGRAKRPWTCVSMCTECVCERVCVCVTCVSVCPASLWGEVQQRVWWCHRGRRWADSAGSTQNLQLLTVREDAAKPVRTPAWLTLMTSQSKMTEGVAWH